jgi:hypothetical protein
MAALRGIHHYMGVYRRVGVTLGLLIGAKLWTEANCQANFDN